MTIPLCLIVMTCKHIIDFNSFNQRTLTEVNFVKHLLMSASIIGKMITLEQRNEVSGARPVARILSQHGQCPSALGHMGARRSFATWP